MPTVLIIDRNSTVKTSSIKTFNEDELYKKAGFKLKDGFIKQTQWDITVKNKVHTISLYGKTNGRAGQENKYEFPPPVDTTLFFGSCLIVCWCENQIIDVTPKEWEMIYEFLYGGFHDIGEDSEDSSESEDDDVPRTKEGYVKDGFIVDDDADDTYSESSGSAEERVFSKSKRSKPATRTRAKKQEVAAPQTTTKCIPAESEVVVQDALNPALASASSAAIDEPLYLSCTNELIEESYI
jgi:hypothetical protein